MNLAWLFPISILVIALITAIVAGKRRVSEWRQDVAEIDKNGRELKQQWAKEDADKS